ncbi:MAG TPA: gluconate 2-dehydrogenase subunit 3 family protein [Terriglobia bacterium]|nr:gluconate 2-dehydrogenase subunit 3 family protein [Terriglobia bacterium]
MSEFPKLQNEGRRQALKKIALGAGATAVFPILEQPEARADAPACCGGAASEVQAAADLNWKPLFFDPHQNETVIALTDLIIPETDTPGAKAALANRAIDLFLHDEEPDAQRQFLEGLAWIDGRALDRYGKPFVGLTREQQTALLEPLADPENKNPEDQPGVRFFEDIKDWTLFGYYTSQIGLEQELQYGGDTYHESFPGACTHPEHQS